MKIKNFEFIPRDGGSTESVLFEMVVVTILNFEEQLLFLQYLTNNRQIL